MKKLLRWLFMGVLFFAFVGCGGGGGSTTPSIIEETETTETNSTEETNTTESTETNSTEETNTTESTETNSTEEANTTESTETNSTEETDTTKPLFRSASSIEVAENQTTVITVDVTDNNTLSYSLLGTDVDSFSIGSSSGIITFNLAPNYESKSAYSLSVIADDGINQSTQNLTISITDIADVSPTLTAFSTEIAEDTATNTDIGTIVVSNVGDTNITSFDLNDTTYFEINASGDISTKSTFDYETTNVYTLSVTATNEAGTSDEVTVSITINDVVDVVPRLEDVNLIVSEDIIIKSNLGNITITETGDTDISSFEINGTDSSSFSIATDGTITLESSLDYETKTYYEFNITAINEAGRSNTISLEINITDINETSIALAVYDNNNTVTVTDDTLRIYFSQAIDITTWSNVSANNYALEGTGDLDNASGVYSTAHKEDRITSMTTALEVYETNLSVLADTIKDNNGRNIDTSSLTLVSAYTMKQTGQTLSYEENGSIHSNGTLKDDGYYQSGLRPSYSRDDSKEVVLDHITGLMWADDTNVSIITKQWVTTNNYNAGEDFNTSGDTATTYCSELSLGGYSDWRLPSIDELVYITDKSKISPSIDENFKNVNSALYWSSSTHSEDTESAGLVDFNGGYDDNDDKNNNVYVRCVRARE